MQGLDIVLINEEVRGRVWSVAVFGDELRVSPQDLTGVLFPDMVPAVGVAFHNRCAGVLQFSHSSVCICVLGNDLLS